MRDELRLGRDVDAVHVGEAHWGRRGREIHLSTPSRNGGAIVYHPQPAVLKARGPTA